MAVSWFKFYTKWHEGMKPLTAEEKGRLLDVIVEYVNGERGALLPNFVGSEKYIWPIIKADLDRDREASNNYGRGE